LARDFDENMAIWRPFKSASKRLFGTLISEFMVVSITLPTAHAL